MRGQVTHARRVQPHQFTHISSPFLLPAPRGQGQCFQKMDRLLIRDQFDKVPQVTQRQLQQHEVLSVKRPREDELPLPLRSHYTSSREPVHRTHPPRGQGRCYCPLLHREEGRALRQGGSVWGGEKHPAAPFSGCCHSAAQQFER